MPSSTVRTIVAFGLIAVVLSGAVVGGARFIKARNDSYVTKPSAVATNKQPRTGQPKTAQPDASSQSPPGPQQSTDQTSASASTGQTAAPASLPPVTNSTSSVSKPVTIPQTVPNTSATGDLTFTFILMVIAAFFGSKLLKARADCRRYVES
jgi:hypothetical protein